MVNSLSHPRNTQQFNDHPISSQKTQHVESLYSDTIPWYAKLDDKSDRVITAPITKHESSKLAIASYTTELTEVKLRNGKTCKLTATILAAINREEEVNRWHRRVIQQRYRKRVEDRAISLAADTTQLKNEIQKLAMQHQLHLAGIPTKTTPWRVVVAYWDIFQNGLTQPKLVSDMIPHSSSSIVVCKNFLHAVMAPNVSVNAGFGVDALLEDWRLLSLNIEDLDIRLIRLEYEEEDNLVAKVRGTATITEAMLRNGFPHLVHGIPRRKRSSIASRLLGRQLVVCTTTRFIWDSSACQIVSAHYTVDLETPLLNLLGSWEDVAYILSMPFTAQGTRRWTGLFD